MLDIEAALRRYVASNFLLGRDAAELRNDESFLESGLIDSTGVLELIAFLEAEFEIRIPDEDLIPENLDSVDAVVAYVTRRRASDRVPRAGAPEVRSGLEP